MPRSTVRTIALAAKVSHCTVSRALRGDVRVSKETRDRIQKLADEMGYEVNPYVSSWMAHVRSTKAVIAFHGCVALLNYQKGGFSDTARKHVEGATARAREFGYRLEHIEVYRDGLSAERVKQILRARAIRCVLLPVSGALSEINLSFDSFACVPIGHRIGQPPLHFTSADHHTTMVTACTELSNLGYKRIGFFLPKGQDRQLELRFSSAYLGWQWELPPSRRIPPLLYENEFRGEEAIEWCRRNRLDSVICLAPPFPFREMFSRHFRIPEDLGMACLDWQASSSDMAGVDQRHEAIGAARCRYLGAYAQQQCLWGPPNPVRHHYPRGLETQCDRSAARVRGSWFSN